MDPYYLAHKAQQTGYFPEIITASRRINDHMGVYVADEVMRLMTQKRIHIVDSNILVMGLAFKENCPDLRNTRVIDIVRGTDRLQRQGGCVRPVGRPPPCAAANSVSKPSRPPTTPRSYDAVIITVAHACSRTWASRRSAPSPKTNAVIFDIKYLFPADAVDGRL